MWRIVCIVALGILYLLVTIVIRRKWGRIMWKIVCIVGLGVLGFLVGSGVPLAAFWVALEAMPTSAANVVIFGFVQADQDVTSALRWALGVSLFAGIMGCLLGAILGSSLDRRRRLQFTLWDLFAAILFVAIILSAVRLENAILHDELEKWGNSESMGVVNRPGRYRVDSDPSVALSPEGKLLATGNTSREAMGLPTVRLWDLPSLRERPTDFGPGCFWMPPLVWSAVAFSPDGNLLAASLKRGIVLWDVSTRRERATISPGRPVTVLAFSPDSRTLVGALVKVTMPDAGQTEEVKLWDVATGQEQVILQQFKGKVVDSVAISSDGRTLATAAHLIHTEWESHVQLWDMTTGNDYATVESTDWVRCVAFSPDGKVLACGETFAIKLRDVTSGHELASSQTPVGLWHCVAFSPDGTILATANAGFQREGIGIGWGHEDGLASRLWDVVRDEDRATVQLRPRCTLQKHSEYHVNCQCLPRTGKP